MKKCLEKRSWDVDLSYANFKKTLTDHFYFHILTTYIHTYINVINY